MEQPGQPKVKHKSFTYRTRIKWVGGKAGMLGADGRQEFRVASPPEFRGEAGVWTPEDLFIASVESCTMATLCLGGANEAPVESMKSTQGGPREFGDGGLQFTRTLIRPTVSFVSSAER